MTDWELRELEMTLHARDDPGHAGIARRVNHPGPSRAVAAVVVAGVVLLALGVGVAVGWWVV